MKRPILLLAFTLSNVCCLTSLKSSRHLSDDPSVVILQDTSRNTTLQFTQNGSMWTVTSGDPDAYLAAIAGQVFGVVNAGSFQNSVLEFDSGFTRATLSTLYNDANGNRIPLGVEFACVSQSAGATFTYQYAEAHTCTGAPCSCCEFLKNEAGKVTGCKCSFVNHDCQTHEGPNRCNHTVSTN